MTAPLAPPHPDTVAALDAARNLIRSRVPVFVAPPRPDAPPNKLPFHLPNDWQLTEPDEGALDAWQPGWAVCAVMGQGLDLLDFDPRNAGGTDPLATLTAAGELPEVVARASTPSGGEHLFVRSMGVGTPKSNLIPGFDVKAGLSNREGRGFAFIAPTERASKVTGDIRPYVWTTPPPPSLDAYPPYSLEALALARRVRAARRELPAPEAGSAPPDAGGAYTAASVPRNEHTGPIPEGSRHTAVLSYAGHLRSQGVPLADAERAMLSRLADCAQPPEARSRFTPAEAFDTLRDAYGRYAGGTPDLEPVEVDEDGQRINPLDADTLDEDQIEALPDREPLITGLLDRGTYVVIYAEPKAGKSLFALDLAECVARGIPWNGHECQQESVLWVAAEGSGSMRIRQPAWRKAREQGKSGRFSMVRRAVPLDDPRAMADLVDIIKRHCAGFVVIDTWADSLGDADEDKSSQTRAAHRAIREQLLAATPGGRGCVVVLAHARKSPRGDGLPELRGSSAFRAAVDAAFVLVPEAGGRVLVRQTDNRDGARCEPFAFVIEDGPVLAYDAVRAADAYSNGNDRRHVAAEGKRDAVVAAIRQHEHVPGQQVTRAFIARVTQFNSLTLRGYLVDLVDRGLITSHGKGVSTYYRTCSDDDRE